MINSFTGPKETVEFDEKKQTKFAMSFLCTDVIDNYIDSMGLNILSNLLFEYPNGILFKALIESGFAPSFCPGNGTWFFS